MYFSCDKIQRESLNRKKHVRCLHRDVPPSFLYSQKIAALGTVFLETVILGVVGEARSPSRHRSVLERSVLLDWTVCDL